MSNYCMKLSNFQVLVLICTHLTSYCMVNVIYSLYIYKDNLVLIIILHFFWEFLLSLLHLLSNSAMGWCRLEASWSTSVVSVVL
jgi:hypothetical protein